MKHKGSTCDFMDDRNRELLSAFIEELGSMESSAISDIWPRLSRREASRFYVSETRALSVLRHRRRTGRFPAMHSLRREMYEHLWQLYCQRKEREPWMPEKDIVYEIVNSPAPNFYLTPGSIRTIIYSLRS